MQVSTGSYVGAEDPDSGPGACKIDTLPTETSALALPLILPSNPITWVSPSQKEDAPVRLSDPDGACTLAGALLLHIPRVRDFRIQSARRP